MIKFFKGRFFYLRIILFPHFILACDNIKNDVRTARGDIDESFVSFSLTGISSKKGVGTWYFGDKFNASLADAKVSWYYNWKSNLDFSVPPAGTEFVPMIWGRDDVTTAKLTEVKKFGNVLLGFNEPDGGGGSHQSGMSVSEALDFWPQLMATGMQLCGPATAGNPNVAGSWQDQFMTGVKSRNFRVDKICVHWYGGNFDPVAATAELKSFLTVTYQKYNRPIWLTEYALINWASSNIAEGLYPSFATQAEFIRLSTAMMDTLPFVERYAWFSLPCYAPTTTNFEFASLSLGFIVLLALSVDGMVFMQRTNVNINPVIIANLKNTVNTFIIKPHCKQLLNTSRLSCIYIRTFPKNGLSIAR